MNKFFSISFLFLFSVIFVGCQSSSHTPKPMPQEKVDSSLFSYAMLESSLQAFDAMYPWRKSPPKKRYGISVLLDNGYFLTNSESIANANFISLKHPVDNEPVSATVVAADYGANLALLKVEDADFIGQFQAIKLADSFSLNQDIQIQFKSKDDIVKNGDLSFKRASTGSLFHESLLIYNLTIKDQTADYRKGLPLMQDKKLVGILRSFDRSTSEATAISLEVIKHFIADSSTLPYKGFPRGGYGYQSKPSNELRQFLGLPKDEHGVFVTYVRPQSPADKGGLKERDIILEIAGYEVLQNGSYKDEVYGDLELKILTSVRHKVGDELKFKVWRDKKEIELTIKFDRNPAESQPVESYRYDKDFEYYIAGGLLFIELSRPFLKKWGEKWWTKAPAHLVNIERNQWKLLKPDQKVVVLASIMRTPSNAGYDDFRFNVLKYVNGTPINGLKDLRNSIETNQKPLVELTFEEDPGFLVLDPSTFGSDAAFLQKQYGIPNMTNMKK